MKVRGKGGSIEANARGFADSKSRNAEVTGVSGRARDMLGSREHQAFGCFLRFGEVVDRMDGDPKHENTEHERQAERRPAPPLSPTPSHGNSHQPKEREGKQCV